MSDQPVTTERERHAALGQQAIDLIGDDGESQHTKTLDAIIDVLHAHEQALRVDGVTDVLDIEANASALVADALMQWVTERALPELDDPAL